MAQGPDRSDGFGLDEETRRAADRERFAAEAAETDALEAQPAQLARALHQMAIASGAVASKKPQGPLDPDRLAGNWK